LICSFSVIEEGDEEEEEKDPKSPSRQVSARGSGGGSVASLSSLNKPIGVGVSPTTHFKGGLHHQETILEGLHEDEEGSAGRNSDDIMHDNDDDDANDFVFDDDEDNVKEPDPMEMNLRRTFEDFANDNTHPHTGGSHIDMIPISALQTAFIRLFNIYIDSELIDQAAFDSGEVDPGLEELTLNEFRSVYLNLDKLLKGEDNSAMKSDGIPIDKHRPITPALDEDEGQEIENQEAWETQQSLKDEGFIPVRESNILPSSTADRPAMMSLNLKKLPGNQSSSNSQSNNSNSNNNNNNNHAAGSGLQGVRNVKSSFTG
jgi:hypothetical protein